MIIKDVEIGPIYKNAIDGFDCPIVNEVDTHFTFIGEIAEDILSLCGQNIIDECYDKVDIPLPVGSAIVTNGCQYDHNIIHAVVCKKNEKSDFYDICDATRNALLLAECQEMPKIVFTAIGCYAGKLGIKDGIYTVLEHINDVLYNVDFMFLKQIKFCARNKEEYDVYIELLDLIRGN